MVLIGTGHIPGTDLGPVITPQSQKRIHSLIQSGIDEGADCILDGRNIKVPGYETGNFVGPTILVNVKVALFIFILLRFAYVLFLYFRKLKSLSFFSRP